ncbi:MAG: S8 family serine peptidase [Acidobacteria bacterium]|nr:S8 family serine peptidase [Acidobacteriota bacterium]
MVKVSREGRISDDSIEKGLRWVIENRERYNIRILNISLGGDTDATTTQSRINQFAEELVSLGVVITIAAGNSTETPSIPPANSPSVITVGGYSDRNRFNSNEFDLYHSSFGATADGIVKPEIIAPAMFVAAPILPETQDYRIAETLSMLAAAPDYSFRPLVEEFWNDAGLDADVLNMDDETVRKIVGYGLHRRKIVTTHYQHVDGTSFAAPITASVAAQMLEANPRLSPAAVKNILVTTAERIKTGPAIRQGFGVMNAKKAVELAASEKHYFDAGTYGAPRRSGELVSFAFHDDNAASVNLVGDFNDWDRTSVAFKRSSDGFWYASIKAEHRAKYRYKILIDGYHWVEDPTHGMKEEDGFGGFHSILDID